MRRFIALLCLLLSAAAPVTAQQYGQRIALPTRFDPASDYITPGQDEPGYQAWYRAAAWRPVYVRAFNEYLNGNGVGGIVPTWQLLRTATEWGRCGADPFEVPPSTDWGNIVATLRYVREAIVPALGPVEPVSVYRNPILNACAGGAEASTHREMGAVDVVPLRPISREALMVQLCLIHAAHPDSNTGLGFYKGLRFHIDARKYREWGTQGARGGYGCAAVLAEGAAPFNPIPTFIATPPPQITTIPSARITIVTPPLVTTRAIPHAVTAAPVDPLAPVAQ